jgi:hypothetical protein
MLITNIRVHGWFGEDTPYRGKGVDITEWLESVDDETVYRAAYTFEKSLVEEYQFTPVLVDFDSLAHPLDVLSIVGVGSGAGEYASSWSSMSGSSPRIYAIIALPCEID